MAMLNNQMVYGSSSENIELPKLPGRHPFPAGLAGGSLDGGIKGPPGHSGEGHQIPTGHCQLGPGPGAPWGCHNCCVSSPFFSEGPGWTWEFDPQL